MMTRRAAVRKPRVSNDLRARRYRGREARMFRTWTFSNGADFTRLMRKCRKSLPRADLRARRYRRRKARKLRTWTFSAGGVFTRLRGRSRFVAAKARLMRNRRAQPQVLVRGGVTRASMPDWYMTWVGAAPSPRTRVDLRLRRYWWRKARKFRTWTFSAGGGSVTWR